MEALAHKLLYSRNIRHDPAVSIVTTVYDRVDHLERCLDSVSKLTFKDIEQLVVSDHPPTEIAGKILSLVRNSKVHSVAYVDLEERTNNWGIGPAKTGLKLAKGKYLAFLSDDNGYMRGHFEPLVKAMEEDPSMWFVYSSCFYDGWTILPRVEGVISCGEIDLGQPLFRTDQLRKHALFSETMAWDWVMIEALIKSGAKSLHINTPSFIFRLAKYPAIH